jgi:hypothetical protein
MDEDVNQIKPTIGPKTNSKLKIKQRRYNKLKKHNKILDNLIIAANIDHVALVIARDKVETGKNGNKSFRTMASKLDKYQLIKLREDLKMINFG